MVALRCKYCGAPLDEKDVASDSPYVTCSSCGTTQQRMDAKAYLDQMMNQVKSWLSSAIPVGLTVGGGMENIDPVARHSIFVRDIKGKVDAELTEYKFSTVSLLGNCLAVMPFSTMPAFTTQHTTTKAFEFNAKVKSVSELAIDESSKALINEASCVSQSYAMMLNNIALLKEDKEGRYILMANNFRESAKALKDLKGYEPVLARFDALATVCDAFEYLIDGNTVDCEQKLRQGRDMLVKCKESTLSSVQFGIMYQAIEQEVSLCDVTLNILESIKTVPNANALQMLNIVKKVMDIRLSYPQEWGFLLGNKGRYTEVLANIVSAMEGKNDAVLPITSGQGKYLMPFWEVDLRYSFTTGALWKKKSVEVREDLLVCADFVTDSGCLTDPASAVTDIFKLCPESTLLDGLKGNETSISQGAGIGRIHDSAANNAAGARKIFLPLSTKREAEKLCVNYLAQRIASNTKLNLGKPEVKRLLYLPCDVSGNGISIDGMGQLTPARVLRMNVNGMPVI